MKSRAGDSAGITGEAARWLVRRDGGLDAAGQAEFARWCAADPRHAAAVAELERVWCALEGPARRERRELLRVELRGLQARRQRRWRRSGALAGVAVVLLAVAWWRPADSNRGPLPLPAPAAAFAGTARVLEPTRQRLPDGSVVELPPGAEIHPAFDAEERVVILRRGEAHFSVVRDPTRPFTVVAGSVRVRAVGTAFAVQLGRAEVEVVVTEGTVSVAPPAAAPGAEAPAGPAVATAGQRAVVPVASGAAEPVEAVRVLSAAELAERLAWRQPRIEFSETTLTEAIAWFNRRSAVRLRAADDGIAALRITGVFRADNTEGFVRALEATLGLRAEQRPGEIVLRRGTE